MTDPASPEVDLARTSEDLLTAAFRLVSLRIEDVLDASGVRRHDVLSYLDTLVSAVRRTVGSPRAIQSTAVLEDPLFGLLVDALASELVRLPEDGPSALAAIHVLRAIATMKGCPTEADPAIEQTAEEELRAQLHSPDAFELLVEVAHDFRSPLTSILFLAETLRDGNSGPVTEHQRSQLGLMYSAAFGLASVSSDIMDLARQERDLIDEPEAYALREVFRNVERLVRPIVEEKALTFRIEVPERGQAVGHPHALSRILLNLTTNALKFTEKGTVEVGVIQKPRSRLEYYVRDTGRGIPLDRQPELFHPFKRRTGHRTEGHFFSGSGVGLSIARRLVEGMGSELKFETSDATGTRFWFDVSAVGR